MWHSPTPRKKEVEDLYHGAREWRVQSDGGAHWTDGHPRAYGGGGDGARGSQRWRGGGHQGLLAAEQRLAQGGEAFLRGENASRASISTKTCFG